MKGPSDVCPHVFPIVLIERRQPFDGNIRVFTASTFDGSCKSSVGYVAVAVRKYEYRGQFICDYIIASKFYSKKIDIPGEL